MLIAGKAGNWKQHQQTPVAKKPSTPHEWTNLSTAIYVTSDADVSRCSDQPSDTELWKRAMCMNWIR